MTNAGSRNGVYAPDVVIFKIARRIETKLKTAMTSRTRSCGRRELSSAHNPRDNAEIRGEFPLSVQTIKPALKTPRHSACFLEANAPMTPQNPAHSAKPPIPARLNHSDVGH